MSTYSFKEETFPPEIMEHFFTYFRKFGSATVNKRGNDLDIMAFCSRSSMITVWPHLLDTGWKYQGTQDGYCSPDNPQNVSFINFRKGPWNFILFNDVSEYKMYAKANDLCRALNLTKKSDRITVFNHFGSIHSTDWMEEPCDDR
jgi:hypothetical protein